MNLREEIEKIKLEGYNEANAQARLCQDIILYGIANGSMSRNVTVKGGVVMRNLSKDSRRATQDIDLDFIRYSISDESIAVFVRRLELIDGVSLSISKPTVELKHQDYKGKRIFVEISDQYGNRLESKIDIGVHKDFDIEQDEYCFDICFDDETASLLMNSREQIIAEKLKSFIRVGTRSTRYKDVFDICYLCDNVGHDRLRACFEKYIFSDETLHVNSMEDISKRVERVLTDKGFVKEVNRSGKNWLDISYDEAAQKIISFLHLME